MSVKELEDLFKEDGDYVAVNSSVKVEDNRSPRERFIDSINEQLTIADNPNAVSLGMEKGEMKYKKSWFDASKNKMDVKVGIFNVIPSKNISSNEAYKQRLKSILDVTNTGAVDKRLEEIEALKLDATKKQTLGRAESTYKKLNSITELSPKQRTKLNDIMKNYPNEVNGWN